MEKKALIEQIIKNSGALTITSNFFNEVLSNVDVSGNETAAKQLEKIKTKFNTELEGVVLATYIPKYEGYFTESELQELYDLAQSPIAIKSKEFELATRDAVKKDVDSWLETVFAEFQNV